MCNDIELYLDEMNRKLSENVMGIVTLPNDVELKKINVCTLLEYLFNLLSGLLTIKEHILYTLLSKLILFARLIFTVVIQNGVCHDS